MKRMVQVLTMLGLVVGLGGGVLAQAAPAAPATTDLTGKWTMSVKGGPHGDTSMGLVLKQQGEKITAGFDPGHGDEIPMTGTFAKASLTLESPANSEGSKIVMKGTLKPDGSLSGFLSSQMGDMTWSAKRDKNVDREARQNVDR